CSPNRDFCSRRRGCHTYHWLYGMNCAALCLRPEISVDDVRVAEPLSGTAPAVFSVSLSSEEEVPVTVAFATADGTAHAGEDYVPTSGTLTFAPHQRAQTVSVDVKADSVVEPDETFSLRLSNESSGTMIDGEGVA